MNQPSRIPALDGLRGIAILAVVVLHLVGEMRAETAAEAFVAGAAKWGWVGVDLFFVLSGFLITRILLLSREEPRYFQKFYWRRSLRIFPLYYFAIAVGLLWIPYSMGRPVQSSVVWQHALYVMNLIPGCKNYFPGVNTGHFWSLCVEEHFYLVWPAVVLVAGRKRLPVVCTATLIVSFLLRVILPFYDCGEAFLMKFTPTRLDGLIIGSAMAAGGIPLLAKILGSLYPAAILLVPELEFPLRINAACLLAAVSVALSIRYSPQFLCDGPLPVLGKYSYGIYVWHYLFQQQIVFATSIQVKTVGVWPATGVGLASSLGMAFCLAYVSYHILEKPFLAMKSLPWLSLPLIVTPKIPLHAAEHADAST